MREKILGVIPTSIYKEHPARALKFRRCCPRETSGSGQAALYRFSPLSVRDIIDGDLIGPTLAAEELSVYVLAREDPSTGEKQIHSHLDSRWCTATYSYSCHHIPAGSHDLGRHTPREDWR